MLLLLRSFNFSSYFPLSSSFFFFFLDFSQIPLLFQNTTTDEFVVAYKLIVRDPVGYLNIRAV